MTQFSYVPRPRIAPQPCGSVGTDGQESRISGPTGSAIPFDAPATMAFDHAKKSLLIANHAIFGDPAHFAVLRVFVADPGNPLPTPSIP